MKLTKKKAIELSIEKWEDHAKTGEENRDSDWHERHGYPRMSCDCAFCEYSNRHRDDKCESCPYLQGFSDCCKEDTPYNKWLHARTPTKRKQYAELFLEQLKQL